MHFYRSVVSRRRVIAYLSLFVTLVFLLVSNQRAIGQVDEGSVTGTVLDSSGAVVPNARVSLRNTDQGLTLERTANEAGQYTFSPVRIGNYTLSVTAEGFAKTTQQNLQVSVSQNLQVNVQLKPGAMTETVEVTTAPPALQTEDASVGQVVTTRTLNSLPLNGRNFTFLAQLSAGVNTPQADTRGNASSGAFTANGLRPSQNNYLLDGIDNNSNAVDFLNGTNFVILPPLDAIQEFKVSTADFSAEYGRSAGAVMNATIKSGTNSIHGNVWEYFRNDVLDAADYFESNGKGRLRLNQFGGTIGGPIIKDKIFFFGDYEGLRRVQGNTQPATSVPTMLQRNSGYTDLSELIASTGKPDALGRTILTGTVLDPATTRQIAKNVYVRDPFGLNTCSDPTNPTPASCPGLNKIPSNRIDPNAVKILNLFPAPTSNGVSGNFQSSPSLYEHRNAFDIRTDFNPIPNDQIFARVSYVDDPQFIPGPFGGIADGGAFNTGNQTAKATQAVVAWTHVFSPSTINVARAGWNHLHTTRNTPNGSTMGIPAQFGIQGIPQIAENGGLPEITFGGLSTIGTNGYLPSDEVSETRQAVDDFTKIYKNHSFKVGFEFQNVKFFTLQPPSSRGGFDYNGSFTDIPNQNNSTTGIAQFLLLPQASSVAGGVNYVGGMDSLTASSINKTYDDRKYIAGYFQDNWKITPNLTLNIGIRWDYFSPISETNGGQANFIQNGPPNGGPIFLMPASGKANRQLSSTANNPALNGNGFLDLLAKDGITLVQTDKYGKGLVQTQKNNLAPRFGLAYQVTPSLVIRAGAGLAYNAFENLGYGPNIGLNYPFAFSYNFSQPNLGPAGAAPLSVGTPYAGCSTAGPGGTVTLEAGLSCLAFSPLNVSAQGISLQGMQFNAITPRTFSSNVTLQYSVTRSLSAQVAYVLTETRHLTTNPGSNRVSQILPAGIPTANANDPTQNYVPFPDFNQGPSYLRSDGTSIYNGLQTQLEQRFADGLSFLFSYTYSKTLTNAGDLLNGGSLGGFRAPNVPGFGIQKDWGPASFDLRNVFHFSGTYQLPIGRDKLLLAHAGKLVNAVAGGWSINWIATVQGGQPITISCPIATTSGTNCIAVRVAGQSQKLGKYIDGQGLPNWFGNPKAFQQPCLLGGTPGNLQPIANSPLGCVALNSFDALGFAPGTTTGPNFRRLDYSMFKTIPINDRFSVLFRAEFFNILNHPNFNAPGFGGNGVVGISNALNFTNANFGEMGSTRDAPFDPRQVQFALKLFY